MPSAAAGIAVTIVVLFRALVGRLIASLATKQGWVWLATILSAADAGWSLAKPEEYAEVKDRLFDFVVAKAMSTAGLELDRSDPFSDASLCAAIGKKTGIALRTLKDRESIKKDVEHWALALLEAKTGLHIRDVRNKEKVIKDVMKFASPVVADATGLPLTDISDADKVKGEVKNYLKDRALVLLAHDLDRTKTMVQDALKSVGSSLELLAKEIERKGGTDPVTGIPNVRVDATMIALGVLARALIQADKRRREEEMGRQKVSRRTEQMRAALARFREKNGHRMTYERV